MESIITKKIIINFFDGKATSLQRKMIEEWLKDSGNYELYYKYLDEWEAQHPQYSIDRERGLEKINLHIDSPAQPERNSVFDHKQFYTSNAVNWMIAATIILVFIAAGSLYLSKPPIVSYEGLVDQSRTSTGEIYEKNNLTTHQIVINLPDNSSVILQPNSKISYSPKRYNKTRREVILSGEAFFEVQKDSSIPFYVYASSLITKVLGTSFSVNTNLDLTGTEVIVKTGRVAVFMQSDKNKEAKLNGNQLNGIVLTANEKIRISEDGQSLTKPVAINPGKLLLPIQKLSFDFDETPATDVLDLLKKTYGIPIVYDPHKLSGCKLTAHLSDEPLLEKIKLICIALDAEYKEEDSGITIKSNGCK